MTWGLPPEQVRPQPVLWDRSLSGPMNCNGLLCGNPNFVVQQLADRLLRAAHGSREVALATLPDQSDSLLDEGISGHGCLHGQPV